MAGVQGSALAIAVSQCRRPRARCPAGCSASARCARSWRRSSAATRRPFNVNFFAYPPPRPDRAYAKRLGERRSRRITASWASTQARFPPAPGAHRSPRSGRAARRVSSRRWSASISGCQRPSSLARVRAIGAKIISSATTVEEARRLEAQGADAVIAQGLEAGGHRGNFLELDLTAQPGTLALVPQVVRAVNVPVIAAGGIADANGVAAAMALGAAGVQVGTAYLLCPEATHQRRAARGAQERRRRVARRSPTSSPAGRRAAS